MSQIAKVAVNGSNITEAIKSGHVTYSIENYVEEYCIAYDENGACIDYDGGYWQSGGSGSTGAKITGTIVAQNSKLKVGGKNVAVIGDQTNEVWEADPPIPSSDSSTRYTATSSTSGSGQGTITGGNNKNAKLNGQLIAAVGSEVTTCLGSTTTIADGENSMNM
ncbi:hypothetical protein [Paenibacillus donghaensis]|uniref:hypothetical protein n=1 Tax=Paenibacillus donghaensis TaxID=414771 RepID=UPI0012FD4D5B|nr:hypothetical protein [Paenibacillus donghaensis]